MTPRNDALPASGQFLDPAAPGYVQDPYPHLAEVRANAPVHELPIGRTWILLEFEDAKRAFRDPAFSHRHLFSPEAPWYRMIQSSPGGDVYLNRHTFVGSDAPEHTASRQVLAPPFTRRAVARLRDRAEQIVDEVLSAKRDGDVLNLVEEVAYPLPYRLTCDLVGVEPLEDLSELHDWTWKGLNLLDVFMTPEQFAERTSAARNLNGYLQDVVAWKRANPGDDVATLIIDAAERGEGFTPDQVVGSIQTLYFAGMDTTVNQSSLSVLALMRHRDQWELLRDHPDLMDGAVEELLRFDPTAQFMVRHLPADVTFGHITIPAGSIVIPWIASANRDPLQWGPTAEDLDITRADARHHLAFGSGIHLCLGAWLARMELHVLLTQLIGRFPNTELATDDLRWKSTPFIRGLAELPLLLRR